MTAAGDRVRAIDCFVNARMGSGVRPTWLARVAEDYFHRTDAIFQDFTPAELVAEMDAIGVDKAVLSASAEKPDPETLKFPRPYPDRFVLSASLDPRNGIPALRALEALVKSEPVVLARVFPFMTGLAPNDKVYYPLYTKCVDWDLPVSTNAGIPGPPAPGEVQNPLYLDEVCLYFPELTIIMAHGADPWWNVAIRLMLKYRNLYLMTSAYAPKYFPAELVQFMNTRGRDKILFASDHPVLAMRRCMTEAQQLDLREGVLDKFLYANAQSVLFERSASSKGLHRSIAAAAGPAESNVY